MTPDFVLQNGGYRAEFSLRGATCYRLYHEETDSEILRRPDENFAQNIFVYGNPVLFPPNRIRGGMFTFDGRTYAFPVNEPLTGCHLHGALHSLPFTEVGKSDSEIVFSFSAKAGEYLSFPHAFEIIRRYTADANGLTETTTVYNRSNERMPFMLAYHTTFNLPFTAGGCAENCRLRLAAQWEQVRNEKFLPTGERRSDERLRQMRTGEYVPYNRSISALCRVNDENVILTDTGRALEIVYTADSHFGYRLVWSKSKGGYIVLEPQTCAVDCFHLSESPEENGLLTVEKGDSISLTTRIYIRSVGGK